MEHLLELDRKLKQSDTIEALLEFKFLLESNPNIRETGMLKLAEYFHRYPIHVLLALDNIPLHPSFISRVLEWMGSNDPLLRAMSLRLLGSMNVDTDELRYVLLKLLKSSHGLEYDAACFCIERIAKSNSQFAIQVCRLVYHRVHKENIKVNQLYRVFGYVGIQHAQEVYGILRTLIERTTESELQLSYLVAMTLLVSNTVLLVSMHIDYLMNRWESPDEMRLGIIECLIYLATKHFYQFELLQVEHLFKKLAEEQNWACKSRISQCLALFQIEKTKSPYFASIALDVLKKGIEEHPRFCIPVAKLVRKLAELSFNDSEARNTIQTCIYKLMDTPTPLKTKLVWILLPLVPQDLPMVLERTKELSYPYLQKNMNLSSFVNWDNVLSVVDAKVQLQLLRKLIPFVVPYTLHFNSFPVENLYEIGLLLFSRGHRQSVEVFKRLTCEPFQTSGSNQWLQILYELAQADSELSQGDENAIFRMYSALSSLRALSIVRPCHYQISYLTTQIQLVVILIDIHKGIPVQDFDLALKKLKTEFIALRDVIQMDNCGRHILNFYLFQIDTLLQVDNDTDLKSLSEAKNVILSSDENQRIQQMLRSRPHPYCFFILSEPFVYELRTKPEIKSDFAVVVPKPMDFVIEIDIEVRLAHYLKKFAVVDEVVVELTSSGRVLDQFSSTEGRFHGQIQVPMKPKTRYDSKLEVHAISKGNRYLVVSRPVSFRK
jgi:hypothetical protein